MKLHRILLIHPSHYDDRGRVVRANSWWDHLTVANIVHLALPVLAAYVPKHIDVALVEDCFEDVPYDDSAELVAISAQVMQIQRALDIAKRFREKGKIVVMGGFLPTMHPELVRDHVDSICIGDGYEVWPQMLRDIESDKLQKSYDGGSHFDLKGIPAPRYDLVKKNRPILYPVYATAGCPYRCDYCSIVEFHRHTYRLRPIDEVIRDIKATKSKLIYMCDDGLMENVEYAKQLFKAMRGLGIQWGTQTTINCANDPELLRLAHESGCRFVSLGMESLNQKNLVAMKKGINQVDRFKGQIEAIHRSGISAHVLIIIGLDEDTPETYEKTFDYLMDLNVPIAEFFLCTPYPKTPFGRTMVDSGRIVTSDLSKYREGYVVFKHPSMTEDQILKEYWKIMRRFYTWPNILRRIWRGTYQDKMYHLANAFFYWLKIKRNIVPVYFGRGNTIVD